MSGGEYQICGLAFRRGRDKDGRRVLRDTCGGELGGGARLFAELREEVRGVWLGSATLQRDGEPDGPVCQARFFCGHSAASVAWDGLLRGFVYNWLRKRRCRHG